MRSRLDMLGWKSIVCSTTWPLGVLNYFRKSLHECTLESPLSKAVLSTSPQPTKPTGEHVRFTSLGHEDYYGSNDAHRTNFSMIWGYFVLLCKLNAGLGHL